MKKTLAMILVFALLTGVVGIAPAFAENDTEAAPPLPPHVKDGVSVVSVFAAPEIYPLAAPSDAPADAEPVMLDAILIYYSDNTFDQYVQTPNGYELFSTGTYTFKEDGDFILSENEDEDMILVDILQQYSMKERMLVDNELSQEYKLGSIRYDQIFGPEDGREVEAIFVEDYSIDYEDENDVVYWLDGIWLYFADGTFEEYVFLNGAVSFFGSGSYEFDEAGDFHIFPFEEDSGTITQTWEKSNGGMEGETLTFYLGTMGSTCLFEKYDAAAVPELPVKAA